jgi:hypothetical protein
MLPLIITVIKILTAYDRKQRFYINYNQIGGCLKIQQLISNEPKSEEVYKKRRKRVGSKTRTNSHVAGAFTN